MDLHPLCRAADCWLLQALEVGAPQVQEGHCGCNQLGCLGLKALLAISCLLHVKLSQICRALLGGAFEAAAVGILEFAIIPGDS